MVREEGANTENIVWLRNLGAALVAVNGAGALLAARDPLAERNLYDVVMLASVLETIALGWSTVTWEFSATEEPLLGHCGCSIGKHCIDCFSAKAN